MIEPICIIPSLTIPSTFFIFRETGIEVQVMIRRNLILPSHNLTNEEVYYIHENILEVGEKIIK